MLTWYPFPIPTGQCTPGPLLLSLPLGLRPPAWNCTSTLLRVSPSMPSEHPLWNLDRHGAWAFHANFTCPVLRLFVPSWSFYSPQMCTHMCVPMDAQEAPSVHALALAPLPGALDAVHMYPPAGPSIPPGMGYTSPATAVACKELRPIPSTMGQRPGKPALPSDRHTPLRGSQLPAPLLELKIAPGRLLSSRERGGLPPQFPKGLYKSQAGLTHH